MDIDRYRSVGRFTVASRPFASPRHVSVHRHIIIICDTNTCVCVSDYVCATHTPHNVPGILNVLLYV